MISRRFISQNSLKTFTSFRFNKVSDFAHTPNTVIRWSQKQICSNGNLYISLRRERLRLVFSFFLFDPHPVKERKSEEILKATIE